MGAKHIYSEDAYVTEFQYHLRGPADTFTDEDFERVRAAVLNWSDVTAAPVKVRKTRKGFEVAITHPLPNGDSFGMSLYLDLSAGIFRELKDEDKQLTLTVVQPMGLAV